MKSYVNLKNHLFLIIVVAGFLSIFITQANSDEATILNEEEITLAKEPASVDLVETTGEALESEGPSGDTPYEQYDAEAVDYSSSLTSEED